jgi:hypothetical protein
MNHLAKMFSPRKNGAGTLWIQEAWRARLEEAGLHSMDVLLADPADWAGRIRECACFSCHVRGQTYRVTLADGQVMFIKRDSLTQARRIFTDLLAFRRPEPLSERERLAMASLTTLGVSTPPVIAHGQLRRQGLPWKGVLVTECLPGVPLDELLGASPSLRRRQAMAAAGTLAGTIYAAGFSMPDFLPKHVLYTDDGQAGILDVERMERCYVGLASLMDKQIERFCDKARQAQADEDDIWALVRNICGVMDSRAKLRIGAFLKGRSK